MTKIALFVDVQNIYYTTREAYGRQFDYKKLWRQLSLQGEIVSAIAYAIESDNEGQRKFQNALRKMGFVVKLKPYIQRKDGSAKGDWDVGITIDVIDIAPDVDKVVLLSGDGDFDLLLDRVHQNNNLITEVYGVPQLTAKSLIQAAKVYHQIESNLLI
ncbi:nuclease [Thiomicrorhabdus immobilis]|uniref:Nuclease n=1 Tax=Thiomicrorhabdus immobilis TaxID=2791037 RepID=A0ABN6D249_9GAMM|nr:NYN domain-containing protein [Thiomicrorhabdus immobilis]BCN94215.1 nuclease [Thiomicrorhabdus immobilis]